MTVYNFLDIIGTLMELLVFYVVSSAFHITTDCKIRRYLPYIIWGIGMYMLTWYTDTGEYKPIVGTMIIAVTMCIFYRVSFYKTAISCMFGMILIFLTESMGVILAYFLKLPMSVMVGEQMLASWEIYLLIFIFRAGTVAVIHYLFKNYLYEFTWKDCCMVLFNFIIILIVWVMYNRNFFDGESDYFNLITEFLCLLLSVGVLIPFFYLKNYYILRERVKQDEAVYKRLQEQYAYYRDKQKEEERVRSVYHDLKNHLLVLQAEARHKAEIQDSLQILQKEVSAYENYHHTGNDFLDIIIRDKSKIAKANHIDFSALVDFEAGAFIDPLDISALFGNALDNAIEASVKLPEDKRIITVKASRIRDMLIATVENNTDAYTMPVKRTTKADEFLHGIGLANIKKAAEKYEGSCSVCVKDGVFVIKIMIPIPV